MTTITERDSIGRRLKASRTLVGLDQQQIADAVGVARTTVSGWERGQFEPTFSSIVRWSQTTGQPLEWFAAALETGKAPAEAEADPGLSQHSVRPKRLELPTFCMGVKAWTVADDLALMLFAASERVNGDL